MSGFLLFLLLVLNFGISWWNAAVTGKIWIDTKQMGGFMRVVAWSALIQSVCGFTYVIAISALFLLNALHVIHAHALLAGTSLVYVAIILPILGSGIVITIHSWIVAFRQRSITNMGVATYNTFAMAYDTVNLFDNFGDSISEITSFFGSSAKDDEDDKSIVLIVGVVALLSGVILTHYIMRRNMGTLPLPSRQTT